MRGTPLFQLLYVSGSVVTCWGLENVPFQIFYQCLTIAVMTLPAFCDDAPHYPQIVGVRKPTVSIQVPYLFVGLAIVGNVLSHDFVENTAEREEIALNRQ
jgi:hypothetical protein